ncbi:MAG TPA: lactate utilization protein C [Dermatophilaceae bacterium]|nr:lactate utilization protein C [Dermatophilaceae bacterium]
MKAREEILQRVQSANIAATHQPVRRDYAHTVELADPVATFVERVEDYKATVIRTGLDGVAAAVAKSLEGARRVVVPAGFNESWLPEGIDPVPDEPALSSEDLDGIDAVLTSATVAIAVTGTIVLDHTEGQGRRALTLVPDLHVCVLTADQIVGDVPEAVARLSASVDAGRPLTWVSGPSATVDIELIRVHGVHGPRTLRVVLVESTA